MYGSKKEELLHFHYIIILAPSNGLNPKLRGYEYLNFGRGCHRLFNHVFSFSQQYRGLK